MIIFDVPKVEMKKWSLDDVTTVFAKIIKRHSTDNDSNEKLIFS